jgi:hypothetical protein
MMSVSLEDGAGGGGGNSLFNVVVISGGLSGLASSKSELMSKMRWTDGM